MSVSPFVPMLQMYHQERFWSMTENKTHCISQSGLQAYTPSLLKAFNFKEEKHPNNEVLLSPHMDDIIGQK